MSSEPAPNRWRVEAGILLGTAAVIYLADQLTKALVVSSVALGQRKA